MFKLSQILLNSLVQISKIARKPSPNAGGDERANIEIERANIEIKAAGLSFSLAESV